MLPPRVTFSMVSLLPKETSIPWALRRRTRLWNSTWRHIFTLQSRYSTHPSRVRNPTSPIVGGGENHTYHNLHILDATNSGNTFSCSWMQSPAVFEDEIKWGPFAYGSASSVVTWQGHPSPWPWTCFDQSTAWTALSNVLRAAHVLVWAHMCCWATWATKLTRQRNSWGKS